MAEKYNRIAMPSAIAYLSLLGKRTGGEGRGVGVTMPPLFSAHHASTQPPSIRALGLSLLREAGSGSRHLHLTSSYSLVICRDSTRSLDESRELEGVHHSIAQTSEYEYEDPNLNLNVKAENGKLREGDATCEDRI